MTHTFAFVNLKPGVGKSTSAVFFATALDEANEDPLLVDADKGLTVFRWDEMAGGLGYPVVAKASKNLHTTLPDLGRRHGSVVVDVPQVEDHAVIARGALRYCDTWILPVAPSGPEVDRMLADDVLGEFIDDTQGLRRRPADVVVLLNRTNTSRPTRTGPDAEVREVLTEKGYDVLTTQIPHVDAVYRQQFGTRIRSIGTPYERVLKEIKARQNGAS